MGSYETSTAVHFIVFAVLFTLAFGFATWRIIRNLEKENERSTNKPMSSIKSDPEDEEHSSKDQD